MNKDKLQKLFALAANNPNPNEASVAALKFIQALQKSGQPINITLGNSKLFTEQQVRNIADNAYNKGYQWGYEKGYNEGKDYSVNRQYYEQKYVVTNGGTAQTTTGRVTFGNRIVIGQ